MSTCLLLNESLTLDIISLFIYAFIGHLVSESMLGFFGLFVHRLTIAVVSLLMNLNEFSCYKNKPFAMHLQLPLLPDTNISLSVCIPI